MHAQLSRSRSQTLRYSLSHSLYIVLTRSKYSSFSHPLHCSLDHAVLLTWHLATLLTRPIQIACTLSYSLPHAHAPADVEVGRRLERTKGNRPLPERHPRRRQRRKNKEKGKHFRSSRRQEEGNLNSDHFIYSTIERCYTQHIPSNSASHSRSFHSPRALRSRSAHFISAPISRSAR